MVARVEAVGDLVDVGSDPSDLRAQGGELVDHVVVDRALLVVLVLAWAWWRKQGSAYEVPTHSSDRSAAYEDEVV